MPASYLAVSDRTDRPLQPVAEGACARRILCVFPRYEPSLGSFEYAYDITGNLRAFECFCFKKGLRFFGLLSI